MSEKPIDWRGSSLEDLKELFSLDARKEAGHQLSQVQAGLDPDHWKLSRPLVQVAGKSS